MICSKCGKILSDDSFTCDSCGNVIASPSIYADDVYDEQTDNAKIKKYNKSAKMAWMINSSLGILLVIICVIVIAIDGNLIEGMIVLAVYGPVYFFNVIVGLVACKKNGFGFAIFNLIISFYAELNIISGILILIYKIKINKIKKKS